MQKQNLKDELIAKIESNLKEAIEHLVELEEILEEEEELIDSEE